ncbi:hypothetical protein R1sor_003692 [Riccia sorocarpa]|uniref:Uncharacterized protein n=1 Tax=Riccia sorocarpa TaxID=122646 RepID=A0ABD3H5T8_9MARC
MEFHPEAFSFTLVLCSTFHSAFSWHNVPNPVPVWWNIDAHPIYYLPRWFGFTLLFLLFPFLMMVITSILHVFANHLSGYAVGNLIGLPALFLFGHSVMLLDAFVSQSGDISPRYLVANIAFTLMIWAGFYLPHISPNPFIGILTPWTVRSEHSWTKTHKHAAWILEINGLALLICAFYVPTGVPLLLVTLVLWLGSYLYLVIYSFIVYESGETSWEITEPFVVTEA